MVEEKHLVLNAVLIGQHATGPVSMFRPEVTPDECEYFIDIKNY